MVNNIPPVTRFFDNCEDYYYNQSTKEQAKADAARLVENESRNILRNQPID